MDLSVSIGDEKFVNPLVLASGTAGYGLELEEYLDLSQIGAVALKGLSLQPKIGNPGQRIVEVRGGILNSIGLENIGFDVFKDEYYHRIVQSKFGAIANIFGNSMEDYVELAGKMNDLSYLKGVELNVSCPNVKKGGLAFGQDIDVLKELVSRCREVYSGKLIVKLSPNVTDIVPLALAAEEQGADAVSLINTLKGMAIDIETAQPVLGNKIGGLSGPAVKPVAIRMVNEVYKAVTIPIVGIGGVMNSDDFIEMMMAGATLVSIGTATLADPQAGEKIIQGVKEFMKRKGIDSLRDIIGAVEKG